MSAISTRIRRSTAILAPLLIVGACSSEPPADPIDQARAAVQAKFGADVQLNTAAIKTDSNHTVVCGLAGFGARYIVVDGKLLSGPAPASAAGLVAACEAEIPTNEMPPVI